MLHALEALAAQPVDPLHARRRQYALHRVEPILQLLLDWLHFLLERVVGAYQRMHAHIHHWLLVVGHVCGHLLVHHTAHLLLIVFNERWLHHVDPVLALYLVAVVHKEGLVTRQLLLYRLNGHLVYRLTNLHCIHRLKQLLGYVEDILGEKGPLRLRIY